MRNPLEAWIYSTSGRHVVRYGAHTLAKFVRRELAIAYRDWFWSRRDVYLRDSRLGRFTLEDLIIARKGRK